MKIELFHNKNEPTSIYIYIYKIDEIVINFKIHKLYFYPYKFMD